MLVNLLTNFRVSLPAHILSLDEPLGWQGAHALVILREFIEFKALTLFSFLFGVGVAIQAEHIPGQLRRWFLIRRFGALLAIGIIHMLFIWNGDILTLYAICGFALIPLLGLPEGSVASCGSAPGESVWVRTAGGSQAPILNNRSMNRFWPRTSPLANHRIWPFRMIFIASHPAIVLSAPSADRKP